MELNSLRKDAWDIFQAGLKAVDPVNSVKNHLIREDDHIKVENRTYELDRYERIIVVGGGKASAAMAQPVEEILGERLKEGLLNVKYSHSVPLNILSINESGHPVPDEAGLKGTQQIIQLLRQTDQRDLVICLLSGGGSALMPSPAEGLTLEDKRQLTHLLLESGATIQEINALRKHVSRIKGGRLARWAYPSTVVALILSDVIGDDLGSIASGPTAPDKSTYQDCRHILDKYDLQSKMPGAVLDLLEKGIKGEIEETPKPDDPVFERVQNVIIASNILAIRAAQKKADALGYHTLILSSLIEGEAREVSRVHAAIAKEILKTNHPVPKPACVISGGETTVTIRGQGLGGRNQEFALAGAIEIEGLENVVILSAGTDGTDGPTDAAGAIADGTTLQRAQAMGLDAEHYLRENDSYHFFQSLEDLLMTGPTYTNVMDIHLVMVG